MSNHHASRNTAVHFRIDESAHANVEAQEVTTCHCIVSPNKEQGNEAQGPNKTSCWGWRFPPAAGSTIAPTFAVCAKMLAAILSPSAAMTPGLSFCFHMFHSAMSQCLPPVHRANFALSTFNPVQINLDLLPGLLLLFHSRIRGKKHVCTSRCAQTGPSCPNCRGLSLLVPTLTLKAKKKPCV